MECPICGYTISRPRMHCLRCWREFDAEAVEELSHLKFVMRRLQAWSDDGTIDILTQVLLARMIRAEIAALQDQLGVEEPAYDMAALEHGPELEDPALDMTALEHLVKLEKSALDVAGREDQLELEEPAVDRASASTDSPTRALEFARWLREGGHLQS